MRRSNTIYNDSRIVGTWNVYKKLGFFAVFNL